MQNLIAGFIALTVCFYAAYAPIYIIFFNSSENKIEKANIYDIVLSSMIHVGDNKNELNRKKEFVKNNIDMREKETGIDYEVPFIKVLKKNKKISDLKIAKNNIVSNDEATCFVISFMYEGNSVEIVALATNPNFLDMKRSKFIGFISFTINNQKVDVIKGVSALYEEK